MFALSKVAHQPAQRRQVPAFDVRAELRIRHIGLFPGRTITDMIDGVIGGPHIAPLDRLSRVVERTATSDPVDASQPQERDPSPPRGLSIVPADWLPMRTRWLEKLSPMMVEKKWSASA